MREFSLSCFVHDSNTPAKGNDELKTIVVVPFERLLTKYWVAKEVDMQRFTVGYDHDEMNRLMQMLANPVHEYGQVWSLFLKLD